MKNRPATNCCPACGTAFTLIHREITGCGTDTERSTLRCPACTADNVVRVSEEELALVTAYVKLRYQSAGTHPAEDSGIADEMNVRILGISGMGRTEKKKREFTRISLASPPEPAGGLLSQARRQTLDGAIRAPQEGKILTSLDHEKQLNSSFQPRRRANAPSSI